MYRYRELDRDDLLRLLTEAEAALQADTADAAHRLLHDLQLHQIELEIQNRDLRAAQLALELARDQYAELYDFAPVSYVTLDRNGAMRQLNLTTARLLGRERGLLVGRPLGNFLDPGSITDLFLHLRAAFEGNGPATGELRLKATADRSTREVRIDSRALPEPDGAPRCLSTLTDISETKRLEHALRQSHRELATVLAAAPVGIGIIHNQIFKSLSPRLLAMLGFNERELLGHSAREAYANDAEFDRLWREGLQPDAGTAVNEVETVMRRKDGHPVDVLLRAAALSANDPAAGTVFTTLDISARKAMERTLAESQRLLELALAGGDVGIYTALLPDGPIDADARYLAMLGVRPGDLTLDRQTWRSLVHPDDLPLIEAFTQPLLRGEIDRCEAEYRLRHARGHWVWVLDRGQVFQRDPVAGTVRLAGTHIDVTRRRAAEQQVAYLADHDELTALLNRRGIWRSIERIHAEASRSGRPYAVAMLDLDLFKQINDAYGHLTGDEVLRQIGVRLQEGARKADWIGRWGGEEFALVLPNTTEVQALNTVERLRRQVGDQPFLVDDVSIPVRLSAGLAVFRPGEDSPRDVVGRADVALYRAKETGRNRTVFDGSAAGHRAIAIAVMVQDALRTAGILPAYQPIVALGDRRVMAEETFARIVDPDQGLMTASAFLAVARQLGLVHKIDSLLFRTALERLAAAASTTDPPPLAFVHLSQDLLRQTEMMTSLANELSTRLSLTGQPSGLVLSIDEQIINDDAEAPASAGVGPVVATLAPFLALGCRLAVAGVGGRASSYQYLSRLPVEYLVIDPTLLRLAAESSRAEAVVAGIVHTAATLGQITIAKQIEDEASAARAAALGITWGQGFLFGEPSTPARAG